MTGLVLASCDRAFAPDGCAPAWVHLFPEGKMTGRDGRLFDLADPGALVLAFQSSGVDLPIDYEHQNDLPEAKLHGPVPAAGWIKELKADAGGLWGRVEWTATAAEMIGRKEYRYLSPSFLFHPKTRHIVRLKGAGLVHNPNLHLKALASQEPDMTPDAPDAAQLLQSLVKMLGLGPDATEEDVLAALVEALAGKGAAKPDPKKYVPVAAVQAMMRERNTEQAELAESRAVDKVKSAMSKGYLTGGLHEWALELCRSDEAAFDTFIEKSVPPYAHLLQEYSHMRGAPSSGSAVATSGMAAAVCAQLGLKPDALKD